MEKITPKLYRTKKPQKLTDVQVRIYNSSYNFHKPLEIKADELTGYIYHLREEGKDIHGRPNWQKFTHLPLVSFVDMETKEEIIFENEKELSEISKSTEIRSSSDKLIALFS